MKGLNNLLSFLTIIAFGLFLWIYLFPKKDWRMSNYQIHGIDISHYQETVNFERLKAEGNIRFVFVKATEGISLKDERFKENWSALKENNLIRGAYHFYRPSVKAKKQAQEFIKTVTLQTGDLPPVLDLEETDNRSKEIVLKGTKIWLETIEAHYNVKPIIYVNQDYYKNYIKGHFDDYPIWLAVYRHQKPDVAEGDWLFWQYTDEGRISGVHGDVDKNVFYGNENDLKKLLVK